ncbi:MAG: oligosaccharide repeat unit polymerase [Bacteroidia bacterium]|nr:oligosaccharide repeat unit polymerase [Bacteroidia bacterium]MCF8445919.1 oligosaccharide repeat unit polymerase [Bacteroidia bacterium]
MLYHPGTYFWVIWVISTISQYLLVILDIALIPFPDYINELNKFIILTSVFFAIWVLIYPFKPYMTEKPFKFQINNRRFKIFLIILVVGAVLQLIYTWYKLGVTSLNLAEIRQEYTKDKSAYLGTKVDFIFSIIKYLNFFYLPLTIFCGYLLAKRYLLNKSFGIPTKFLLIPLYVTILYVLTNGGRNPLAVGLKLYFFGFAFAIPYYLNSIQKKWIYKRILIASIVFISISTLIADSRYDNAGQESFSSKIENPYIAFFSGLIEYMGAHYWGYQIRSDDSFNSEKLGYGFFTFNGVFNAKPPLGKFYGFDKSLGELLGFEENPIDYFVLWENEKEGYFTTNSIFLGIKFDFGFFGGVVFLLLFSWLTHKIFLNAQSQTSISMISILWFYLIFNFWASSNFQSVFASNIIETIIMFILFNKILFNDIKSNSIEYRKITT